MGGELRQPIKVASLEKYLSFNVPEIKNPISIEQFEYGQSNPTYQITASDNSKYVLRKKPPGSLVSNIAHQVEREFRIIRALEKTNIPVPKVYCLCEDDRVIGTPFYIMEYIDGRIFKDPRMPNVSSIDRREMWCDAVRTLGKLHNINPVDVGLKSFGRSSGFYDRQIKTMGMISKAQANVRDIETLQLVGAIPHIQDMLDYFSDKKTQPQDRSTLIHGDFKIDNLVYHRVEPKVIGILDWEMSTIGHPLSDLVNLITPFSLANKTQFEIFSVFSSTDLTSLPRLEELIALYAEVTEWDPNKDLRWGIVFGFFRMTAICQGIASRYAVRQATNSKAKDFAEARHLIANLTWELVLKNIETDKSHSTNSLL